MSVETAAKPADIPGKKKTSLLTAAWLMAHRWKGRIVLAVLDQGIASTTNFLLTILCVVWLPLDAFGRYVIVWSISLLFETAQASLILDAMPAIVARYGQFNRRRFDTAALWVMLIYAGCTSLLIAASVPGFMRWAPEFVLPVLCLAAANPCQRLYVFLRRLCYIRDRQDVAASASFAYGSALMGGAFALHLTGWLSVHTLVLLWGFANGTAVVVIYARGVACTGRAVPKHIAWLGRQLWRSGRWLIGAALGFWLTTWGMLPLIAAMSNIETAGVIRALQNLFTPVVQFNAALNLAILPRVADKVVDVGRHYARSFAIYSTALFTGVVLAYVAVVTGESEAVLSLLYRKPEIAAAAYLLWPLAIAMVLEAARQGSTMALLSLNVTRTFFTARVVSVSIFVLGILTLGKAWGAEGILWANAMSHSAGTAMIFYAAMRLGSEAGARRQRAPHPAE